MTRWSDSGEVGVDVDSLRLEPGSHSSPRDGVCLLELTSILAHEEFSDRPRCVCEVIAAFLRGWNDRSSHAERQRLRPYAERVIGSKPPAPVPDGRRGWFLAHSPSGARSKPAGPAPGGRLAWLLHPLAVRARSRAGRSVTRRRRDICLIWAGADLSGNALSRALRRLAMRFRILILCGIRPALRLDEGAGELAARVVFARYDSRTGLRLVDSLLEVGSDGGPEAPSAGGEGSDALARAIGERALRGPASLPPANGSGNGNGHREAASHGVAAIE
jgi:hypothetical protein